MTKFETGEVKTVVVKKSITRAIDTPVKTKTRLKEYTIKGELVTKKKSTRISSVWSFDPKPELKSKETNYYPGSDTLKKEVSIYKNGELVKTIKRK